MSNEIEVGEYIRDIEGKIYKADNIFLKHANIVVKTHSKNLIDLIEVGDMVNKEKVNRIYKSEHQQYIVLETRNIFKRDSKDIKTILTHEQYEQNCYKVVE